MSFNGKGFTIEGLFRSLFTELWLGFPFNSIENVFTVQWMDLLNFFVFELYYTREFMLKVLIQMQKTFKTSWKGYLKIFI